MIDFEGRISQLREKYKALYKQALSDTEKDIYFDIIEDLRLVQVELEQDRARNSGICEVCGTAFEQNHGKGRKGLYCSDACKQKAVRERKNTRKRQSRPYQLSLI